MNNAVATPEIGIQIYEDKKNRQKKGCITFYGDTIKRCNFDLFPTIRIFGKGKKLYLSQLDGVPENAKSYPFQKDNTIRFGGNRLCEDMEKFVGRYFLLHDDGEHSYYIDTEESRLGDVNEGKKKKGGRPRKVKEVPAAIREKTKELYGEHFLNPVQPAIKEIAVDNNKEKSTDKTFFEQVSTMFGDKKTEPTPEPIKVKANTFVIDTLRELSDECIDNDDLAGAKALLKAIRKFTEMK